MRSRKYTHINTNAIGRNAYICRQVIMLMFFLCCSTVSYAQKDTLLQSGLDLYNKGDYNKSIEKLEERLKTAISNKELTTQKVIYNSLGNNFTNIGKTKEALEAYQKAITIAESLNDRQSVGRTLKNIGGLYSDIKDFDKAVLKYKEAEIIAIEVKDTSTIADCANNTGVVYEQQAKYPEALEQYQKAIQLYKALNQTERIAILYNNLGIVYKFMKDYEQSIKCYQQSLTISKELGNKFLIAANQINIGNVYEMKGDYKTAILLNEQGLQTGIEINSREIIIEATGNLAEDYAKSGDYKNGFVFYKKYVAVKDSFISAERSGQLAEMQTKYETEKKELQIISLEKARYKMLAVIGVLVLLIAISLLLYRLQQIKQRQAREKAVQDAEYNERLRIAKDVHDDLGSGLSKISLMASLAQVKAAGNNKLSADSGLIVVKLKELSALAYSLQNVPDASNNLEQQQTTTIEQCIQEITALTIQLEQDAKQGATLGIDVIQIAAVSKELIDNMRDLIWVLNPENTTLEQLVSRLREYCADYLEHLPIDMQLHFPDLVPDMRITREVQRNIFLSVKEAINNCIKHAQATEININLKLADSVMDLTITDNGRGFDEATLKRAGNGLRNMRQRIEFIGGTYELTSQKGATTVHILVDYKKLSASKIPL